MEWELLDLDLLHGSDTELTDSVTPDKNSESASVIDDGMILSDHFSFDNLIKRSDPRQYGVLESGRVDYGSEYNPGETQDDARDSLLRVSGFEAPDEKQHESEAVSELAGGTVSHSEDASKCLFESDDLEVANEGHVLDSSKSWSVSGGNDMISGNSGIVSGDDEMVYDNTVETVVENSAVGSGDESKNRETVWWKTPFVLLKYCAFNIGPVWSVSMAAAVMGLVLLGRRLYNMKKKAQRFRLKVTIDDKKASRVMNQTARLNEVFREVRRVPVIRPALPSPAAWPVVNLR